MFSGLRARLTIIFLGLAILPVAVIVGVLAERTVSTLQDEAVERQRQDAQLAAANIDSFINERDNQLAFLTEARGIGIVSPEQQRNLLNDLISYDQAYYELALLDGTGQELHRVGRTTAYGENDLVSRADREAFLRPLETGSVYFSPVRFDETAREPLITIARPVFDLRTNELAYVLVAEFRFRPIWTLIADAKQGEDNDIFVTNSEGRLVAHANPSFVLSEIVFDLPEEDGRSTGLSGTDVILARTDLQFGEQTLFVVAEQSTSTAFTLATDALQVIGVVAAISFVGVVVLIFVTVRQLVRPIERLSSAADEIRSGNLGLTVPVRGRDEIATLGQAFNDMSAQLSDSIQNLEIRVHERTRDLNVASEVSRQVTTELDQSQLLKKVAELTREGFGLYHVSIFLYDEPNNLLRLEEGSGDVAQRMKQEGKSFQMTDAGLVPKAARDRRAALANNVAMNPAHTVNAHLPETKAELAVPMIVGTDIIGVLDLQAEVVDRFSEDDVRVITTLAEQIAIAVRNAKLYEVSQEALQEAEKANAVKSQFLASVSHELRTPLNAILNFTQFVSSGMLGSVNEEQVDMLNKATDSGRHLLSLINDVLDISKIEAGSLKLFVTDDVNLQDEIDNIASTARAVLADKENKVELRLDVQPIPLITGDERRLRQIMLNLISNACKFTDEGHITISLRSENEHVLFSVQDTGPGIAPEDHDVIFESFRQTGSGLKKGEGTGLGLPISRRLTEAHNGELWLESTPGKGTTFFVSLPIHPENLVATSEIVS